MKTNKHCFVIDAQGIAVAGPNAVQHFEGLMCFAAAVVVEIVVVAILGGNFDVTFFL